MIFATKKIVIAIAAALLFLVGSAEAVEANKNLRKNNAVQHPILEEQEPSTTRKLATTYSYEYKYQKMKFCWKGIIPWYCYDDTDYRWCVDDTQNDCFPSTIGQNEFWDDDRIKYISGTGKTKSCADRTDIGTGTCTKDSTYSDWTGSACGGDTFDVYSC